MKHRFTIVRLEERIAPTPAPGTGILHENCPPGLEKKAGDLVETPPLDISTANCDVGCIMWNDNANYHARVFDTFDND
jgi:hypothetical protein